MQRALILADNEVINQAILAMCLPLENLQQGTNAPVRPLMDPRAQQDVIAAASDPVPPHSDEVRPPSAHSVGEEVRPVNMKDLEREHILSVLRDVGGSRKKAVARLGISERTLRYKLQQYRGEGFDC